MRYRVWRKVAASRTTEVFLGSLEDGRPVAIKRLRGGFADDPEFVQRFAREAELAAKLDHPNLVAYLDLERKGSRVSLLMEWIDGVNLIPILDTTPHPIEVAVYICAEILSGLDHLHDAELVHRDVAPRNLLVAWDGQVRVTDFGIARELDTDFTTGLLHHGTIGYASPEQVEGLPSDTRSDLFSTGVLLYELLTGVPPFGPAIEYLPNVSRGEGPEPPSAHNPEVTAELDAVVLRMLAHDAADRYQSAREVLADLPPCPAGRAELVALLRELRGAEEPESGRQPSRRQWPWPLDLALLAGLVALGIAGVPGGAATPASASAAVATQTPANVAGAGEANPVEPEPFTPPLGGYATLSVQPEAPAAEPVAAGGSKVATRPGKPRRKPPAAPEKNPEQWITLDEWIPHGKPLVRVIDESQTDAPTE